MFRYYICCLHNTTQRQAYVSIKWHTYNKALIILHDQHRCLLSNLFGSGLVIYWFGFVKEICHGSEQQGILIRNCFPEAHEITTMELF